ncbi:ATP-binding cassette domain-containing protein [Nocardioides sp. B-3]|uniref:ATP-binding cassette domain-containing protein n=1 Tax=Nocardioides sp. B-3 TaxID=2895565 RepID=UPI003FA60DD5
MLPERSVAENIWLGREPRRRGMVDTTAMNRDTDELLAGLGITGLKASRRVRSLSVAEQQVVEIAKAVSFDSRIIQMDEPTAALADHEVELLYRIIATLTARGVCDHLRLPPAQGDLRALRHDHRAQGRRAGRDGACGGARRGPPRAIDGRSPDVVLLPRPAARHRRRRAAARAARRRQRLRRRRRPHPARRRDRRRGRPAGVRSHRAPGGDLRGRSAVARRAADRRRRRQHPYAAPEPSARARPRSRRTARPPDWPSTSRSSTTPRASCTPSSPRAPATPVARSRACCPPSPSRRAPWRRRRSSSPAATSRRSCWPAGSPPARASC